MKWQTSAGGMAGPSSSIGILRFFDVDTEGPKMTPTTVVVLTVFFVLAALVAKQFFGL